MKNMSTLYQHLRAELVPPRVKTMAAAWQVWDSVQEGAGVTFVLMARNSRMTHSHAMCAVQDERFYLFLGCG